MSNTDESSDGHTPPTGICRVLASDELRNDPDITRWEPNLTLDYAQPSNGSAPENTATLVNRFEFAIPGARMMSIQSSLRRPARDNSMHSIGVLRSG